MWCSVFVVLISLGISVSGQPPMAKTEFGSIQGKWGEIRRGHQVARYLGIPYAEAPTGELRFQKPSPWRWPWRKPRKAVKYPPPCLTSFDSGDAYGREDCLYLNVFTKLVIQNPKNISEANNETKHAVLVFLISDTFGDNNNALYEPYYLLTQDIVLVTVNYRLGCFGFFTTGDEAAPGNYGLKDVLEALAWLQRNIAAFGGDPKAVTLMGQGAGAGVVHHLALSKRSKGFFHRYITQSGAALAPWSYRSREMATGVSGNLASSMNCALNNSELVVKCMRNTTAVGKPSENSLEIVSPFGVFGPTDEPESEEAVITEHPKKLMLEGKALDIPWLTGTVADEGLLVTLGFDKTRDFCEYLAQTFERSIIALTNDQHPARETDVYVKPLKSYYFDNNITTNCFDNFIELAGDAMVNWPVYETLTIQSDSMKSNVYFYQFNYNGTFTTAFEFDNYKYGVCHGDELIYLFRIRNKFFGDLQFNLTQDDKTVINILTEMWGNFVKTGVPSARYTGAWQPYQEKKRYMDFGPEVTEFQMQEDFLEERMNFWSNLTKNFFILPSSPNGGTRTGNNLPLEQFLTIVLILSRYSLGW